MTYPLYRDGHPRKLGAILLSDAELDALIDGLENRIGQISAQQVHGRTSWPAREAIAELTMLRERLLAERRWRVAAANADQG